MAKSAIIAIARGLKALPLHHEYFGSGMDWRLPIMLCTVHGTSVWHSSSSMSKTKANAAELRTKSVRDPVFASQMAPENPSTTAITVRKAAITDANAKRSVLKS